MTDSNLPNNAASGIVSILQQHLDVSSIESHELVKLVGFRILLKHFNEPLVILLILSGLFMRLSAR
jgi:hypothetical protein